MNKFTLSDGTIIEYQQSAFPNGPNQTSGQCYGTSYLWVRINGEKWIPSNFKNQFNLTKWLELCHNVKDFMDINK